MDTSMDDLFSDVDRSGILPRTSDDSISHPSHLSRCAVTRFGQEFLLKTEVDQQLGNAVIYQITLSQLSNRQSASLTLTLPNCSILTAQSPSDPVSSSSPCSLLFTSKPSCSAAPSTTSDSNSFELTDVDLLSLLTSGRSSDLASPVVWLLPGIDRVLYAIALCRPVSNKEENRNPVDGGDSHYSIHLQPIGRLPLADGSGFSYRWSVMPRPGCAPSNAGGDSEANLSSNCGPELIICLANCISSGLVLWRQTDNAETVDSNNPRQLLRSTSVLLSRLPNSVDNKLKRLQPHGSWLHLLASDGSLASLHFSLQVPSSPTSTATRSDRLQLIVRPASFPQRPPSPTSASVFSGAMLWRRFNIADFVRMSDGHLGVVKTTDGTKLRLVDLVRQQPPSHEVDDNQDANQHQASDLVSLTKACLYLELYKRLLAWFNLSPDDSPSSHQLNSGRLTGLLKVAVQLEPSNDGTSCPALLVELGVKEATSDSDSALSDLDDASLLYKLLNAQDGDDGLDLIRRGLSVCVQLSTTTDHSSKTVGCDKPTSNGSMYTYYESICASPSDKSANYCRTIRIPASHWAPGHVSGFDSSTATLTVKVTTSLALDPPFLLDPDSLANRDLGFTLANSQMIGPAVASLIDRRSLDAIHWLFPAQSRQFDDLTKPSLSMQLLLPHRQLVVDFLTDAHIVTSSHGDFDQTIKGQCGLVFVSPSPANGLGLRASWSSSVEADDGGDQAHCINLQSRSELALLIVFRTLSRRIDEWLVKEGNVFASKKNSPSILSSLSIEDLRHDHSKLKILHSLLTEAKARTSSDHQSMSSIYTNEHQQHRRLRLPVTAEKQQLLDWMCSLRNTRASMFLTASVCSSPPSS